MKFITSNPIEVSEAVNALGIGGYLGEPLKTYFPLSDILHLRELIVAAQTNRQIQCLIAGNLTTSWVCELSDRDGYILELDRLLKMVEKGQTIGDLVERQFGVMCRIGAKLLCQKLYYDSIHSCYNDLRKKAS